MATKHDIEAIINAYREAEYTIIGLLKDVAVEAVGTRDWYEKQATTLRQLMEKARAVLAEAEPSQADLEAVLTHGWAEGWNEVAKGTEPLTAPVLSAPAMTAVAVEQSAAFTAAGLSVLRATQDAFREIGRVAVGGMVASGMDRNKALQDILNNFAANGITTFRDRANRKWGLDTYGEMVLRTGVNRAQNDGRLQGYQTAGVTLLHVSQHRGADDHCLPYQNRILSTDGLAGERTVTNAVTGKEMTVYVTATLEDAVAGGLLHVNCRHTLTAFTPGVELPDDVEATLEDFHVEQRQRQIERNIRNWRRMEAAATDDDRAAFCRRKVRQWQGEARANVKANPWIQRRYDRERLWKAQAGQGRKIERFTPRTGTKIETKVKLKKYRLTPSSKQAYISGAITDAPEMDLLAALRAAGQVEELDARAQRLAKKTLQPADEVYIYATRLAEERFPGATGQVFGAAPLPSVQAAREAVKKYSSDSSLPGKPEILEDLTLATTDEEAALAASKRWVTKPAKAPNEYKRPLRDYSDEDLFEEINQALRASGGMTAHKDGYVEAMDRAFEIAPRNPQRMTLHRGTSERQFIGNCVDGTVTTNPASWRGRTFVENAYMSTSIGERPAFSGNIVMHLEVDPGAKMAYIGPADIDKPNVSISKFGHELEVVLQRGTEFIVKSVELEQVDGNNVTHVYAKVIRQRF